MIEHQASHAEDIKKKKLSNDMRDVVLTNCRVCQEPINLTRMRGHTKSRHKMTITEYKISITTTPSHWSCTGVLSAGSIWSSTVTSSPSTLEATPRHMARSPMLIITSNL